MTTDDVMTQLLWMLANRPGYYMWVGWLRSLPVEHQEWVRSQLPMVRQVVAERKITMGWESLARVSEMAYAAWIEGAKKIVLAFAPIREVFENMVHDLADSLPDMSGISRHRWVPADGLQTTRPKFRVVEREIV